MAIRYRGAIESMDVAGVDDSSVGSCGDAAWSGVAKS